MKTSCKSCRTEIVVADHVKRLPTDEVGVIVVGIHCPTCHEFYPSYFTTQELENLREKIHQLAPKRDIRVPHFLKQLETKHDALQARLAHTKTVRVIDV